VRGLLLALPGIPDKTGYPAAICRGKRWATLASLPRHWGRIKALGLIACPGADARPEGGVAVRRIGVLTGLDENDPEAKLRYSAFTQAPADSGWTDGRNVRMDVRLSRDSSWAVDSDIHGGHDTATLGWATWAIEGERKTHRLGATTPRITRLGALEQRGKRQLKRRGT
jgi:hypothetical protein